MKTIQKFCLALSLSLSVSGAALADPYYRGHHDYPKRYPSQHRHFSGNNAALLTIAGVAIAAGAYSYYAPPPVYIPPPRAVFVPPYAPPVPTSTWYYCGSSGQYYPHVRHCPEGWQAVLSAPQ